MGLFGFISGVLPFSQMSTLHLSSAKKKNPHWMVSLDRKLCFFQHGSIQVASSLTSSWKFWKWKIALYNSPLDVDPSMEYACFCIFFGASGGLLFCMISTVHSYCLRWASLVGSSSAITLHKHTFFISGLCLTGLSSMPGKCCYNDLFKFLIVIIGKKMYSH